MLQTFNLTSAAISTVVATHALEKSGQHLSRDLAELVSKFLIALYHKSPKTMRAIVTLARQPQLGQQRPQDYGMAALIAKVEAIAQDDAYLQQTMQIIEAAVQVELGEIVDRAQITKKLGVFKSSNSRYFRLLSRIPTTPKVLTISPDHSRCLGL